MAKAPTMTIEIDDVFSVAEEVALLRAVEEAARALLDEDHAPSQQERACLLSARLEWLREWRATDCASERRIIMESLDDD